MELHNYNDTIRQNGIIIKEILEIRSIGKLYATVGYRFLKKLLFLGKVFLAKQYETMNQEG